MQQTDDDYDPDVDHETLVPLWNAARQAASETNKAIHDFRAAPQTPRAIGLARSVVDVTLQRERQAMDAFFSRRRQLDMLDLEKERLKAQEHAAEAAQAQGELLVKATDGIRRATWILVAAAAAQALVLLLGPCGPGAEC